MSKKRKVQKVSLTSVPAAIVTDEEKKDMQAQFIAHIEANDCESICRKLHLNCGVLGQPNNSDNIYDLVTDDCKHHMYPHYNEAQGIIAAWIGALVSGDKIDFYCAPERKWYASKIIARRGDLIDLHYDNWAKRYDNKDVKVSKSTIYPPGVVVKPKKKAEKKSRGPRFDLVPVFGGDSGSNDEAASTSVNSSSSDSLSLSGGVHMRASKLLSIAKLASEPARKKIKKTKEEVNRDDADRREWVCSICRQLEAADDSDLILCDGLCKRSFHLLCLGLSKEESARMLADTASEWSCEECRAGRHTCFLCNDEGEDHVEVIMCSHANCGKFYHFECLSTQSWDYSLKNKTTKPTPGNLMSPSAVTRATTYSSIESAATSSSNSHVNDSGDSSQQQVSLLPSVSGSQDVVPPGSSRSRRSSARPSRYREEESAGSSSASVSVSPPATAAAPVALKEKGFAKFTLKCPHHFCATCYKFHRDDPSSSDLCRCYRCPRAFHPNCIAPTSRYNSHVLLCNKHPTELLPTFETIPTNNADSSGMKSSHNSSFNYLWDEIKLPLRPPSADKDSGHFRIPSDLQEEIESHAPTFKLIWSNDYDPLSKNEREEDHEEGVKVPKVHIPLHVTDEMCTCVAICDDNCLNRISKIECYEKSNKDSICSVGKECGNRHFTNREYVKVQTFQEPGMGWGLKAKEDVAAGSLVIEYIGEIISEAQMRRRMTLQAELTPHDRDYYIMELSNGLFVDGKRKGNLSRFINHSCDPNCELVRWVVKGRTRIGIFAIKDISSETPLSYDYQFDTQEVDTFHCGCNTSKCRGTMAPKKKVRSKEDLSKKEMKRLIAAGRKRENIETLQEEAWKRSYTGKMLPGDAILEMKNGPPKSYFRLGRDYKLFLPRNTKHTSNIAERRKQIWARKLLKAPGTNTSNKNTGK